MIKNYPITYGDDGGSVDPIVFRKVLVKGLVVPLILLNFCSLPALADEVAKNATKANDATNVARVADHGACLGAGIACSQMASQCVPKDARVGLVLVCGFALGWCASRTFKL